MVMLMLVVFMFILIAVSVAMILVGIEPNWSLFAFYLVFIGILYIGECIKSLG